MLPRRSVAGYKASRAVSVGVGRKGLRVFVGDVKREVVALAV